MAAFREHVAFSTVLGVGYAIGLKSIGFEGPHAILAGSLCGLAGMLPDLDSDSGRPVREMFGFLAAVAALITFHRLGNGDLEFRMLLAGAMYLFVRFGFSYIFKQLTVHRGMCHSLPAALIAGLGTYLAFNHMGDRGALAMAGGVMIGFTSHLLLDEIYAVDFKGLRPKLNQFAGSALKFTSKSGAATLTCWIIVLVLGYRVAVVEGYMPDKFPTMKDIRSAGNDVMDKLSGGKRGKPISVKLPALSN